MEIFAFPFPCLALDRGAGVGEDTSCWSPRLGRSSLLLPCSSQSPGARAGAGGHSVPSHLTHLLPSHPAVQGARSTGTCLERAQPCASHRRRRAKHGTVSSKKPRDF